MALLRRVTSWVLIAFALGALNMVALTSWLTDAKAADLGRHGDPSAGAALVQSFGCAGCHGAQLQGGSGPKLVGIERRRSRAQIARAITDPVAPMPKFDLTRGQVADVVAYLSQLDGGVGTQPRVSIEPVKPTDSALVRVWFPEKPPRNATVEASMSMGHSMMGTEKIKLRKTRDPHTLEARVPFEMGGAWMIKVRYGKSGKIEMPVNVGGE
jgi:mono/diheme cytochrome c family protein